MSYNYNRDSALYSYYMMFQDSNTSSIVPYYNASFADLVVLGISSNNGYSFNGTVQGFLEELTNNEDTTKFWNGSGFANMPMANTEINGGITNATFIDWSTRLTGDMGTYTNYVNWITDVSRVANAALTNADAAAGVATCASSNATAALNAIGTVPVGSNIMGYIGNVSNIPNPYTNIIDWNINISSVATNADSNATNAINAIGTVPSGNNVMGYIGNVSNIPSPYTDIIGWVNGELGDISSQLTNIIGN